MTYCHRESVLACNVMSSCDILLHACIIRSPFRRVINTMLPQPWLYQECHSFVVGGETSLCSIGEWVVASPYTCSLGRWSSLWSSAELEPSSRSTWGLCRGCLGTILSSWTTTSRTLAAESSSTSSTSCLRFLRNKTHFVHKYYFY